MIKANGIRSLLTFAKPLNNKPMITIKLTKLIGMDVKGIRAQVTNPIYLKAGSNPTYRTLKEVRTYKEKGLKWVELRWIKEGNSMEPDCGFTGCTVKSNICAIQFENEQYNKIKPVTK